MLRYDCALITGASSGLGEEFVHQLASVSSRLVLVARREERLQELREKLHGAYEDLEVFIFKCDLTKSGERAKLLSSLAEGKLIPDLLINNAGIGDYGDFLSSEYPKLATMMELNMTALVHLTREIAPAMVEMRKGFILNVSSLASTLPIPDFAVYAATKSFVTSFSEALRIELQESNVHVTALCPGPVRTEFGVTAMRSEAERSELPFNDQFYVDKEEVVESALLGLRRNAARVYPGVLIAVSALMITSLPVGVIRLIMRVRPRKAKVDLVNE